MKLRCVHLTSTDPTALRDFYARILDIPYTEVGGRYEIPVDGVTIVITHTAVKTPVNPDSCGLEFETNDVDALYLRLTESGLRATEPVTYPWQWRAFAVKDPDGNNVDFVQYVG